MKAPIIAGDPLEPRAFSDSIDRTISVAPMMGCTDRHCRMLLRMISPHALMFTEMVVTGALIHGKSEHFLRHARDEPCALQIGGSNPIDLAQCALLGEDSGYQEINLNVGGPSDRVQHGGIGACLMATPELVGECISAMQEKVDIPVTVKCRIGIDDDDSYESFHHFVKIVQDAGCNIFYVHARKAILSGLSPKENREIPPLKYHFVHQIAKDFPEVEFYLNGGLKTSQQTLEELKQVRGVMLGRAPYSNPYMLADLERQLYNYDSPSRLAVVDSFVEYAKGCSDSHPKHLLKHLLGLFTGCAGARHYRRHLSQHMFEETASINLVYDALDASGLS